MPTTIYTTLVEAANGGRDLPATVISCYKDIPVGTKAMITLLQNTAGKPEMIHIAWRTMDHGQSSDVVTVDEAERYLRLV